MNVVLDAGDAFHRLYSNMHMRLDCLAARETGVHQRWPAAVYQAALSFPFGIEAVRDPGGFVW